ncbi:hypothetical protein BGZ94_005951, partial [Podila epigama]
MGSARTLNSTPNLLYKRLNYESIRQPKSKEGTFGIHRRNTATTITTDCLEPRAVPNMRETDSRMIMNALAWKTSLNHLKHGEGDENGDSQEEQPASLRNSHGSNESSSYLDQQQSIQSRKDRVNAAVIRAMPLAERARPTSFADYIGQKELLALLRSFVVQDTVPSIILWGPCGVGKTTLARIIAHSTKAQFKEMGATTHGVADVKKAFEDAKNLFNLTRQRTIVFLDE